MTNQSNTQAAKLGPVVTIHKSCSACSAERSESYEVQSDSGQNVYCTHPSVGKKRIGDTCWITPDWCPVEAEREALAAQPTPEPVARADKLVRMVLGDMDTCLGERGWDYVFNELSTETVVALRSYDAAPSPVALQGRDELDKLTLTITFDDDVDCGIEVFGTTKNLTRLKTWLERCDLANEAIAARASLPLQDGASHE